MSAQRSVFPFRELLIALAFAAMMVGVVLLLVVLGDVSIALAEDQTVPPLMGSLTEEEQESVVRRMKERPRRHAPAKRPGSRSILSVWSSES